MGRIMVALATALVCLTSVSAPVSRAAGATDVTVGMGYIPNVQFAPFYVAAARGYYRRFGLNVHFQYGIEPNLLQLASVGKVDFADSGGDEVLTAGAHGLHVQYVLTQYTRFPVAVFALQDSHIRSVTDLRGRTIGIPGAFGASYVGLLALLSSAGIPRSQVKIESIGFNQVQSVAHHKVDAAVGYANNDVVHLRQLGYRVTEFDIYRHANIAGAGLAAGTSEISKHPSTVRAFVRATIMGMRDTLNDPIAAFRITEQAVPEIRSDQKAQMAVLLRTLDFWKPQSGKPLGWVDKRVWASTASLLHRYGQISTATPATSFYTNRFIPR